MKARDKTKHKENLQAKQKDERDAALKKYLENGGKMYDLDHQLQVIANQCGKFGG